MLKISPFNGLLYNRQKVKIADVVAPPYDVISAEKRCQLYEKSTSNIIHLILPEENAVDTVKDDKYRRAGKLLKQWIDEQILVRDREKCFYVYNQRYRYLGRTRQRMGFIGLLKIEDFDNKGVYPHEHTFDKPKQDRLNLIAETRANLSPIFALYGDDQGEIRGIFSKQISGLKPHFEYNDEDNVCHQLYRVEDPDTLQKVGRLMSGKQIFIADGHHRYEAAKLYRDKMRGRELGMADEQPYDYVMVGFVGLADEGLTILPTHRLIKKDFDFCKLQEQFKAGFAIAEKNTLPQALQSLEHAQDTAFVLYRGGRLLLLTLKNRAILDKLMLDAPGYWKQLDVAILNSLILERIIGITAADKENIEYSHCAEEAVKSVDAGKAAICFLLRPVSAKVMRDVAVSGGRMPEKSTYFYPKLLSGLVINKHDG